MSRPAHCRLVAGFGFLGQVSLSCWRSLPLIHDPEIHKPQAANHPSLKPHCKPLSPWALYPKWQPKPQRRSPPKTLNLKTFKS